MLNTDEALAAEGFFLELGNIASGLKPNPGSGLMARLRFAKAVPLQNQLTLEKLPRIGRGLTLNLSLTTQSPPSLATVPRLLSSRAFG